MKRKKLGLAILALLALVLALVAPSLLNVEFFRRRMHRAVERQLGRPVELASLSARILPRPGVVARGVMVHEREGFGAEPFLYADEVQAHLALRTLWAGQLEFSRLHFVRPSLNLVRNRDHKWNLAAFLAPGGTLAGNRPVATPSALVISAADGRINFKLGADKQVFALRDGRFHLEPQADGDWWLRLQAVPMRGDRRLRQMTEIRLEGEIGRALEFSAVPFRLQVNLESGSLAQVWTLITGREPSLRAQLSVAATFEGTPAECSTEGTLTVANLRRWDLLAPPRTPAWEGRFRLRFASSGPVVAIETATLSAAQSTLQVTGSVEDPFRQPGFDLQVNAERLALDELLIQLAAVKAGVSEQARLEGQAQLALTAWGPVKDWQGELTVTEGARLNVPGLAGPVELDKLQLRLQASRLELLPARVLFAPEQAVVVSGDVRPQRTVWPYRLHWQSQGVELDALRQTAGAFGWELFGPTRWQGHAQLDVEWRGDALREMDPRWRGEVRLLNAKFHPPELVDPLKVVEAHLVWRGTRVEIQPLVFLLGEDTITGSLERRGRSGDWRAKLSAERFNLEDLDNLVNPARPGLLARLVSPEPRRSTRWDRLHAIGQLSVKEFVAGSFRLSRFEAQGEFHSGWLELTRLRFRPYGGRFNGRLQADFRAQPPHYRLAGNLRGLRLARLLTATTEMGELFTGMLGAELSLQTAGTQPHELARELQGRVVGGVVDGTLAHVNLSEAMAAAAGLQEEENSDATATEVQSLAGDFRVGDEQVEFDAARLIIRGASLELSGRAGFDGQLDLQLLGEPLRVAGRRPTPLSRQVLSYSYHLGGSLRRPEVLLAGPVPETSDAAR